MTKTKVVVWVSALTLVAVVAGVAVKMIFFPSVDDKFFLVRNGAALRHAPPGQVIVRPTHFLRTPTNGLVVASVNGTGWMAGRNVTFQNLIATAYNCTPGRVMLPAGGPQGNYDFLVTMSGNPQEHLRSAIHKKLGYDAEQEVRDTQVFALKVENPNSDGLKISPDGERDGTDVRNGRLYFTHQRLTTIASGLEGILKTPVMDKTGLTNFYNFSLVWDSKTAQQIQNGTLDRETGEKILAEWGLALEPEIASVELFVVKKVK